MGDGSIQGFSFIAHAAGTRDEAFSNHQPTPSQAGGSNLQRAENIKPAHSRDTSSARRQRAIYKAAKTETQFESHLMTQLVPC
jgi:hypothetical protein